MGPFDAAQWALGDDATSTAQLRGADLRTSRCTGTRSASQQMFDYIKEDKTGDIPKALCTPTGLPKSVTG